MVLSAVASAATLTQDARHLVFNSLSVHDGLPQMSVMSIAQTPDGYMWFATRDGLARYDGYNFVTFREEDRNGALSNNEVTALCVGSTGDLWIGTRCGLNIFNAEDSSFRSYFSPEDIPGNQIFRIVEDACNNIWICTDGGVVRYNMESLTFDERISLQGVSFEYACTTIDPSILLFATTSGLFKYDIASKTLEPYDILPQNISIQTIFKDSRGNIWIGSGASGVIVLSADLKLLRTIRSEAGKLNNDFVRCITEDANGDIIIGTYDGLNIYSPCDDSFRSFKIGRNGNTVDALSFFSVLSAYCDRDNTVWLGSYVGGINYFNSQAGRFLNHETPVINGISPIGIISSIVGDDNGLWIGKEGGGLLYSDRTSGQYRRISLPEENINDFRSNIVNSISRHGKNLWVGLNNGLLHKLNTSTGTVEKTYRLPQGQPVACIQVDNENNVYIGTYLRNSESDLIVITHDGVIHTKFIDASSGEPASFNYISTILNERDGSVLMGSNNGGLYKYNIHSHEYRFIPLGNDRSGAVAINQLYRDGSDRLWVATKRYGLLRLDAEFNIMERFNHNNGLLSDNICSVIEGPDKLLWLSTSNSVASLNPETCEIKVWASPSVEEFSLRSCYADDSQVIFGANNGLVRLNPAQSHISYSARKPHIEFRVDQESRDASFSFSCLDYVETDLIRYQYMLDSFGNGWIDSRPGETEVYYRNLKPGRHKFQVRAYKGAEDKVGSEIASCTIRLRYPMWARWWAIMIYVAIAAVICFGFYHWKKSKDSIEEERKKLQNICTNMFAQKSSLSYPASGSTDEIYMTKFYSLLKDRLADQDLSIELICSELGISKTGLYTKVKKHTGMAPMDFIRKSRLEASVKLLMEKKYSIAEISTIVGFCSPSYYTSCFRKEYGCTPKDYLSNE